LPAPLCVGLGVACAVAGAEMAAEGERLARLRDRLMHRLVDGVPGTVVNGDRRRRLAGNLNVAFPGVNALALLESLPDVAVSTGSACTSAAVEPSYVLRAIGLSDELANAAIRIGLGRFTTEAEVEFAADALIAAIDRQRAEAAA
jgi:cysteine desulfurase